MRDGTLSGKMAQSVSDTPASAVRLNIPNRPAITTKALQELHRSDKKEFKILFLALKTASNAERLYRNLERIETRDVAVIVTAIEAAILEYTKLSWDLRNIATNEETPFDMEIWKQRIKAANDTGDINALLVKPKRKRK